MKSIIQEASSIEKAIKMAWESAGTPEKFTVKILDCGETGFLGFNRKDAIISISYESVQHHKTSTSRYKSMRTQKPAQREFSRQETQHKTLYKSTSQSARTETENTTPKFSRENESAGWTDSIVEDACTILKTMLQHVGIESNEIKLKTEVNGKTLSVVMVKRAPIVSDERSLWASFSYITLQILKRKLRKKLRNLRLRIDSENTDRKENDRSTG